MVQCDTDQQGEEECTLSTPPAASLVRSELVLLLGVVDGRLMLRVTMLTCQ